MSSVQQHEEIPHINTTDCKQHQEALSNDGGVIDGERVVQQGQGQGDSFNNIKVPENNEDKAVECEQDGQGQQEHNDNHNQEERHFFSDERQQQHQALIEESVATVDTPLEDPTEEISVIGDSAGVAAAEKTLAAPSTEAPGDIVYNHTVEATGNNSEQFNIAAATTLTCEINQQESQYKDTDLTMSKTTKKARKGSKNAGSKKGSKRTDRPQSFWYHLCQIYEQGCRSNSSNSNSSNNSNGNVLYKSQVDFLRSPDSGPEVGEQQRMHFSRAYKKYQNGTLGNCEETRSRKRKYEPLEQRVIQYWTEQQQLMAAAASQVHQHSEYHAATVTHADQQQQQQQQQIQQGQQQQQQQDRSVMVGGVHAHDNDHYHDHHHHQQQQQQQNGNHLVYEPIQAPLGDFGFQYTNRNNQNHHHKETAPGESDIDTKRRGKGGGSGMTAKSPLAWRILQEKAREWAKEMGLDDGFQASAGWIDNVLKRHQRDTEARQNRVSPDATVAQRRNGFNFEGRRGCLVRDIQRTDQHALLGSDQKNLRVGDRVTVLGVSQQTGDLVITKVAEKFDAFSPSSLSIAKISAAVAEKTKFRLLQKNGHTETDHILEEGEEKKGDDDNHYANDEVYMTVERRRQGSTQSFSIHDARKVVKYATQGEDSCTMQELLRPGLNQDSFGRATSSFPKVADAFMTAASRVLRPIWEEQGQSTLATSSVNLSYCDTSCAEKINIHALRTQILPMFRRDKSERDKLLQELQNMNTRSKAQQDVLEKLQYARMAYDMAKDLFELIRDIPAKDNSVVYQVDYQPFDASLRGRLFSTNPAPMEQDAPTKSYAPRSLTLQAVPEDLRNALVGTFAHFITLETTEHQDMGVAILCSLADMAHATHLISSWLDFRQNAAGWCDFIQQVHSGISREQAQLLPQLLLLGGTYETWRQAMDEQTVVTIPESNDENWTSLQAFVLRLTTEWQALRDIILALPQYAWVQLDKAALIASHNCAPAAIPSLCLVRIMQACERDIWTLVGHVAQAHGWTIRAKLFDGLLVEARTSLAEPLPNVLSQSEAAVKGRGWDVRLGEGPCFGLFDPKETLPLLQRAHKAMEDLRLGGSNSEVSEYDVDVNSQRHDRMENDSPLKTPIVDSADGNTVIDTTQTSALGVGGHCIL